MSQFHTQPTGLNDIQLTLLRLFSRPMSEQETIQLRDLLTAYYAEKLLDNVEQVVEQKGITPADYDRIRQGN